jgi:hypothetical protein
MVLEREDKPTLHKPHYKAQNSLVGHLQHNKNKSTPLRSLNKQGIEWKKQTR